MKYLKNLLLACLALAFCLGAGCGKMVDSYDEIVVFDGEDMISVTTTVEVKHWNVGDTVELFGYNWTAIDVEKDNTLLLCDAILPDMAFDSGLVKSDVDYAKFDLKTDWQSSSLRAYLNSTEAGGFLYGVSTTQLLNCTTHTERNSVMGLGAGVTEEFGDRVFLLSETEYKDYKETIDAIDAKNNLVKCDMWLRTSGGVLSNAAIVKANGALNMYGYRADFSVAGVRPCIRVSANNQLESNVKAISPALKVGDLTMLGVYEQDGNADTTEKLLWRVIGLSDDNSRALVITEQVVYAMPYMALPSSNSLPNTRYAVSDVHTWLNGEFLTALGTDVSMMIEQSVATHPNPVYSTGGGNAVSAKIFLPSIEEYNQYLKDKDYVTTEATEYAKVNGASVDRQYLTSGYWLRNPGQDDTKAMYVYYYGGICNEGALKITQYMGVRPCAWINIAE